MKTETKRTPGPWAVVATGGDIAEAIAGSEPGLWVEVMGNPFELRKANAAFIVEACNNYEQLKAQRDELAAAIKALCLDWEKIAAKTPCCMPAIEQARAVLAKLDDK